MEVKMESMLCQWNEEIIPTFFKIVNACLFSRDETELRKAIDHLRETDPDINTNYAFGYGKSHLWVHQRPNENSELILPNRLLIACF